MAEDLDNLDPDLEQQALDEGGGEQKTKEEAPNPLLKDIQKVLENFNDTAKQLVSKQTAAAPDPAGEQEDPRVTAARAEYHQSLKQYQTMCDEGKHAEASQFLDEAKARFQGALQAGYKPEKDPLYKTYYSNVKRIARRDHSEMFGKYGPEIEAEVQKLPHQDRLNADLWDEAVERVKFNHRAEIMEAELQQRAQQQHSPQAQGSVGARRGGRQPMVELSEIELEAAERFGYSADEYRDQRAKYDKLARANRFGGETVPVLDYDKPSPGQF